MQLKSHQRWLTRSMIAAGFGTVAGIVSPLHAQLIPDGSLGNETSVVVPNVLTESGVVDAIEGGATRGSNLFHSFTEFNVDANQSLYFANPLPIENIVTRVTGQSGTQIFGTLGVLGPANLYVINPNGITFGPNAEIDVRGSFAASTADRLLFDNGYAFTTINPSSPPLLTINAPSGLTDWLPEQGTITSQADLTTDQNLTLTAQDLDIQGVITANQSLSLLATDKLAISDSPVAPTALTTASDLLLQAGQSLSIDLLQHPDSRIQAGRDLHLRSDHPILADATFVAGGDFWAQTLDGRLGSLISPQDPVFEAAGDFEIADFTGGSLQIVAGGSVTIPGTITINGAGTPFNDGVVTLSNGETLTLMGTAEPTLDIRAGTTQFFGNPAPASPTGADITIGAIVAPGGLVFLTNQTAPAPSLSGDITVGTLQTADISGGGDVVVDSRGEISFEFIDVSGGDFATFAIGGNAGNVTLLAAGDIVMPFPSLVVATGLQGGAISMVSETAVIQAEAPFGTDPFALSTIDSTSLGTETGGTIRLTAPEIVIGGNITTTTFGSGRSGDLVLMADRLVTSQASLVTQTAGAGASGDVVIDANTINLDFSAIAAITFGPADSGNVLLQGETLTATTGAQIASATLGTGDAGDVTVAVEDITLSGFQPGELSGDIFAPSTISSSVQPGGTGNGGAVRITGTTLSVLNGADIGTSTFGAGNAGSILIDASEAVTVDGAVFVDFATFQASQPSGIASEVFTGASGNGGQITVNTSILTVSNGGTITSQSNGDGNAGQITLQATEAITFEGAVDFSALGQPDRSSSATVEVLSEATGQGGVLTVSAPAIAVTNGGQLLAASEGEGAAGNLRIEGGTLLLDGGLISAETFSSTGGNINLQLQDLTVLTNDSRISTTAGTAQAGGNGGNISLASTFVVASPDDGNNDITANAFSGAGGRVEIIADGIFGLAPLSKDELASLLNTDDPVLLNPVNLATNDITAISQTNADLQGSVTIVSPDVDPGQGVVALPNTIVDASRLIARGCSSGGAIAEEIGSLVVTGRGGLPASPSQPLNSRQSLLDWVNAPAAEASTARPVPLRVDTPRRIREVQSLVVRPDGQVILTGLAPGEATTVPLSELTCAGEISGARQ